MHGVILVGNILLWSATVPAILFVLFYSRSHWERNDVGRSTMLLSFSMALILSVTTLATIWPHYPGRIYIRLIAFALIVPALWWRLITLLVVQSKVLRYNRAEKREGVKFNDGD
jgi:hypothetical protein